MRDRLHMAKRGIPQSLSDDDDLHSDGKAISEGRTTRSMKNETLQDRLRRLEEYKKQKEFKKTMEAQTKKPPFRAGVYHHDFGKCSQTFKNPWSKKGNTTKNGVFVFKAGNVAKPAPKIPKPKIVVQEPDIISEVMEEEFQQLKVKEDNRQKEDKLQKDDNLQKEEDDEDDEDEDEAKDEVANELVFRTPQR